MPRNGLNGCQIFSFQEYPRQKITKFSSITGFQYTQKISKYLEFPIPSGRVKKSDFSNLMDRIN